VDSGEEHGVGIAAQGILEEARELGVTVRHVRGVALGQRHDHDAQRAQRLVDDHGLLCAHARVLHSARLVPCACIAPQMSALLLKCQPLQALDPCRPLKCHSSHDARESETPLLPRQTPPLTRHSPRPSLGSDGARTVRRCACVTETLRVKHPSMTRPCHTGIPA